jgi:hypothetical protein
VTSPATTCCPPPGPTCSVGLVDTPEAADAYRRAVELAPTDAERHYLARRLAETAPATPALRATTD